MDINEQRLQQIVEEVVRNLRGEPPAAAARAAAAGTDGVFETMPEAIAAGGAAFDELRRLGFAKRGEIVAAMRVAARGRAEDMARLALAETQMGRLEHKTLKNEVAADRTPGPEDLEAAVASGEHGITLYELAPFGVILAITPSTNPTSTVISNAISMVSAGNAVVFAPHPGAKDCSLKQMQILNRAIAGAGGPPNLLTSVAEPSLRSVAEAMKDEGIDMICATGGAGVVRAALESGKKAIAAGPGNPPVIVDEAADLAKAARDIIEGAGLDNNIICTDEKQIIALHSIADDLVRELKRQGAYELSASEGAKFDRLFLDEQGRLNRELVGRDAHVILNLIGSDGDESVRLLLCEVEEGHQLVQHEQLMPVIPLLRVRSFEQAVELAVRTEHGFRHTAVIHSSDLNRITRFGRAIGCTIFVVNAPSYAWIGVEGEGYLSMTIAGPTGEGITRARHFTRRRHVVVSGLRFTVGG